MKRPRLRSRCALCTVCSLGDGCLLWACVVQPTQVQAFSGQNLWALVNVGAWPNVRVSTLISEVSYPEGFVLLVPYVQSAPSCLLAPGLLPWLMSQEVAFDIGSVSYRGFVIRGSATTVGDPSPFCTCHSCTGQLAPTQSTSTTKCQATSARFNFVVMTTASLCLVSASF